MNGSRLPVFALVILGCACLLAGCKSPEEKYPPPPLVTPALNLDPTQQVELASWWTNGEQLLHLQESHAYVLREGSNRYSKPIERGRWDQLSYAVVRMQPYGQRQSEAQRVSITRFDDGQLALILPKRKPMRPLDGPPPVPEDRLIGEWVGKAGSLTLDSKLQYTFAPVSDSAGDPVRLAGHQGTWSLSGEVITLVPKTPGTKAMKLTMKSAGDDVTLTSADGDFKPGGV
jgi:hypothetical protein